MIDEISEYLADNSIGTEGTDLFYSVVPDGADLTSLVAVLDTGGAMPDRDIPTKSPTFQIFIRSTTYDAGKTKLDSIRILLHQVKNTTLVDGGTYFYYIMAQSEGGHLGKNDRGLDEFSINFICLTR